MSNDLNDAMNQLPPKPLKGKLRGIRKNKHDVPSSDDPLVELRLLAKQHSAWTRKAVAIKAMASDRVAREDDPRFGVTAGDTIKCDLPEDVRVQMIEMSNALKRAADKLKSAMGRQLRQVPIYQQYLGGLFGASGEIIATYLVCGLDPAFKERHGLGATKSSAWRMRCGLAVVDGHLVRRSKGSVNTYSSELRMRLFQLFQAMWKNQRHDPDNKYLKIWRDYMHRIERSERVMDRGTDKAGGWTGKIVTGAGKTVSARGFAFSGGWHKAADVFIEDLYIVWRALEGLAVWPSYYAAKLGYEHGGKISVSEPKMISVKEALECVGFVDQRTKAKAVVNVELSDDDDDDGELVAAAE